MALLDAAPRMASVRSCSVNTKLVSISKDGMDDLLATSATAARSLFKVLLERWRQTEAQLRQSERMAQLGYLDCRTRPRVEQPRRRGDTERRSTPATRRPPTVTPERRWRGWDSTKPKPRLRTRSSTASGDTGATLDALERSDREAELEEVMENEGVPDAWRLAGELAEAGITANDVRELKTQLGTACVAVLDVAAIGQRTFSLLYEVEEGTSRLSGIVGALKGYSYLDQAELQEIDLTAGLDDTLLILKTQLKGIIVEREYGDDVPRIMAYASGTQPGVDEPARQRRRRHQRRAPRSGHCGSDHDPDPPRRRCRLCRDRRQRRRNTC